MGRYQSNWGQLCIVPFCFCICEKKKQKSDWSDCHWSDRCACFTMIFPIVWQLIVICTKYYRRSIAHTHTTRGTFIFMAIQYTQIFIEFCYCWQTAAFCFSLNADIDFFSVLFTRAKFRNHFYLFYVIRLIVNWLGMTFERKRGNTTSNPLWIMHEKWVETIVEKIFERHFNGNYTFTWCSCI